MNAETHRCERRIIKGSSYSGCVPLPPAEFFILLLVLELGLVKLIDGKKSNRIGDYTTRSI